ncbi:MAG: hypothetical protein AAB846_00345 [Patescibacteria group bacterium]
MHTEEVLHMQRRCRHCGGEETQIGPDEYQCNFCTEKARLDWRRKEPPQNIPEERKEEIDEAA